MPTSYYSDITLELCADAATLLAQSGDPDIRRALEFESNQGKALEALKPAILKWSGLGMDGPVARAIGKFTLHLPTDWYFEKRIDDGDDSEVFTRGELLGKTNPMSIAFEEMAKAYGPSKAIEWARALADAEEEKLDEAKGQIMDSAIARLQFKP